MATVGIENKPASFRIDGKTRIEVKRIAKSENRTFANMLDELVRRGIEATKSEVKRGQYGRGNQL